MTNFISSFLPGMSSEQKKDPNVSPFFQNLETYRGRLPSAFFTIGTEDPLLDDSVLSMCFFSCSIFISLYVHSGSPEP